MKFNAEKMVKTKNLSLSSKIEISDFPKIYYLHEKRFNAEFQFEEVHFYYTNQIAKIKDKKLYIKL